MQTKNHFPENHSIYGDQWASDYDTRYDSHSDELDPAQAVAFLLQRAGTGPVLELGVGTGRVAIPLGDVELEVHGLDNSEKMLHHLRAKKGAHHVVAWHADMSNFVAKRPYTLVFCVFNSLLLITDESAQATVFSSVARALAPTGRFVLETLVPDTSLFERGPFFQFRHTPPSGLELRVVLLFQHKQRIENYYVQPHSCGRNPTIRTTFLRYCTVDQLDSMASAAGLVLVERWGDWDGQPFRSTSSKHVSVYRKA